MGCWWSRRMSSTPDPLCRYRHLPGMACWVCELLTQARSEEKQKFTDIWKLNLPHIERRNYARGWQDALAQAAHNRP